jgi:hypothetical protein
MTDHMDIDVDCSTGAAATNAAEKNKTRGRRQRRRRLTTSVANRRHKQQSNTLIEKHHITPKTGNDPSKEVSKASGRSGLSLRQHRKAPKLQPIKVHKKTQNHPKKPKQTILDAMDEEKLYRILQKPEEIHTEAEKTLLQLWYDVRQKAKVQQQQQHYNRQHKLP